jgi:uncharacterized protein (TIGR03435 family)
MVLRLATLAVALALPCALAAQGPYPTPSKPPTVYDVASIKPNKTMSGSVDIDIENGNYNATNVSLVALLADAYNLKRDQVIGLEGPIASARFDIRAKVLNPDIKALDKMSREESRAMLTPILLDRFHIKFHTETRVLPVYDLVIAKSGSKLVQTSKGDAKAEDTTKFRELGPGSVSVHGTSQGSELTAHDVQISALADHLSSNLRRVIVDKTGLQGRYDIWLQWTSETASASMDKSTDTGSTTDSAPTLFTALPEQLGLRLQGAKEPVEVMVIDHVEMPAED